MCCSSARNQVRSCCCDPNPQEARELARFSALPGKTWNPPALAGEYLVVRNEKAAACYRLPVAQR